MKLYAAIALVLSGVITTIGGVALVYPPAALMLLGFTLAGAGAFLIDIPGR